MLCNRLKLNQDKTEVLVFSSSYRPRPSLDNLMIVDVIVACSPMARNIGVVFDNSLSMASHVNLHKISKIRKFLTPETTKAIIHAFVTSKIDYCNSLLFVFFFTSKASAGFKLCCQSCVSVQQVRSYNSTPY